MSKQPFRRGVGRVADPQAYTPWEHLTEEDREVYRAMARESSAAKAQALRGDGPEPVHDVNVPALDPKTLMPQGSANGLRTLSLFSGGGGLDLGFERAGYEHAASYEIVDDAAETLRGARPNWKVFGGEDGDVRKVDWRQYHRKVDVLHGGPPCQPFSSAGRQKGHLDHRDLWPEFTRAALTIEPLAFVAENVAALTHQKFAEYVQEVILTPLSAKYKVRMLELKAEWFGVPQIRRRVFFIGFKDKAIARAFQPPKPTHSAGHLKHRRGDSDEQPELGLATPSATTLCMGAREALGLPDIGYDHLAPTLRCSWTGPRGTTSILSSVSAQKIWSRLHIWPNGVAGTREKARLFVPKNQHFRLSVSDCALLQGFPDDWPIHGSAYIRLGQIGNAVPPVLAYQVASSLEAALASRRA